MGEMCEWHACETKPIRWLALAGWAWSPCGRDVPAVPQRSAWAKAHPTYNVKQSQFRERARGRAGDPPRETKPTAGRRAAGSRMKGSAKQSQSREQAWGRPGDPACGTKPIAGACRPAGGSVVRNKAKLSCRMSGGHCPPCRAAERRRAKQSQIGQLFVEKGP